MRRSRGCRGVLWWPCRMIPNPKRQTLRPKSRFSQIWWVHCSPKKMGNQGNGITRFSAPKFRFAKSFQLIFRSSLGHFEGNCKMQGRRGNEAGLEQIQRLGGSAIDKRRKLCLRAVFPPIFWHIPWGISLYSWHSWRNFIYTGTNCSRCRTKLAVSFTCKSLRCTRTPSAICRRPWRIYGNWRFSISGTTNFRRCVSCCCVGMKQICALKSWSSAINQSINWSKGQSI